MIRALTSILRSVVRPTDDPLDRDPEFRDAFQVEDRRERLRIGKLGCVLVIFLMPLGSILDYAVYPDHAEEFLKLRILCSLITGGLLALHFTPWGERHVFWLGLPIALLPAAFIALMIARTEGHQSSYYAGLNLVLIAVNVVARWTVAESLGVTGGILLLYGAACLRVVMASDAVQDSALFNNLYFLVLTGVIVVAGNALYNQLRIREFKLRFELDRNRGQLEDGNRKLREMDQIRSRFFANISHELRTPLTLLLAPLEALRRPQRRLGEAEITDYLQTMHANGQRLRRLIDDLLDLVRLDSGRMQVQREAVPVATFMAGIVNSARKLAEDRRLRLSVQAPESLGTVLADRDKLEKVLLNLLINAIKFTRAGGAVVCSAARDNGELILQVNDTGVGISEDQLDRVFDRFWQADTSTQRKYQGVGIGLALVKELMEVQGGSVSVSSEVNKGTTFTLRMPWLEPDPEATVEADPSSDSEPVLPTPRETWQANLYRRAELFSPGASSNDSVRPVETVPLDGTPKVLIADDEPDMLRFLRSQLAPHFQVLEAVDGLQAIEKAAQFLPDVILCDMMMPERDGLQVCRELRSRVPTRSLPLILLTARADEETKMAGLEAGANDFLTKPFSGVELYIRLKNLVKSHRLQLDLVKSNRALEAAMEQLKETEIQLVQAEKMASLGRLCAGVIHEINNPLNFAKTGLVVLGRQGRHLPEAARDSFEEILRDINEGIERVVRIVSDLRIFSHPSPVALTEVDLAETTATALRFLAAEMQTNLTVENLIPSGFTLLASSDKLLQVLINLLQNSLDALKTKTFAAGETPTIRLSVREEPDGRKIVSFWDNGLGIAATNLDKIFDPFFTTKDVGEGTGLGLSLCYRMVAEWNGRILVNTEPGRYCEFVLEFSPPADESAADQMPKVIS